jgi:SH3-like domain-containing protein
MRSRTDRSVLRVTLNLAHSRLAGMLLLGSAATPLLAERAAAAPYIGVVTGNEVKLRTGGSQNHYAFNVVRMGQRVVVDREVSGWCKIHMPRWIPVFVHKDYLALNGSRGIVKAGELNIRVVPERAHEVVGNLTAGTEVEVLAKEGDWIKIAPPQGAFAYLNQKYVVKEREIGPDAVERELALLTGAVEPKLLGRPASGKPGGGKSGAGAVNHGVAVEPLLAKGTAPSVLPGGIQPGASGFTTAALRKAESLLVRICTLEPAQRDFSPVKAIYTELVSSSEDRTEISAAEEGLRRVQKLEGDKAALEAAQASVALVEKKNQEIDERLRQARLSGWSSRSTDSDAYLARGWVTGLGRFNGHQGSHRLMKGSQVLYFLQSEEGKPIDLDVYLNKRVAVKGNIRELDPKFGANLILVNEIEVLSDR